MGFKVGEGLLVSCKFAPVSDIMWEHAGVFKVVDCGADDGSVGDWFRTVCGEVLANFDLCPEVGEGLVGAPLAAEVF